MPRALIDNLRRAATLATACALAAAGMAETGNAAEPAEIQAPPTIDTHQYWDGSSIGAFGPQFTSIGQVVKIPAGKTELTKFELWMNVDGPGPAVFNGEVYTFKNGRAGREVWESKRQEVEPSATFTKVQFNLRNAEVKPGKKYLLFVSTSKHYEESGPDTFAYVGAMFEDLLNGTYQVGLSDSGDESQWTTGFWGPSGGGDETDLAIKVWLR